MVVVVVVVVEVVARLVLYGALLESHQASSHPLSAPHPLSAGTWQCMQYRF